MAQKTTVVLIDDLDGGEADESVSFGLDGVEYTIDLSTANAGKMREQLADFVASARRVGGRKSIHTNNTVRARSGNSLAVTRELNAKIRQWARENNLRVSDRGRISTEIVEQYKEAHPTLF